MGFDPTWLRRESPPPPASQNHFSHWHKHDTLQVSVCTRLHVCMVVFCHAECYNDVNTHSWLCSVTLLSMIVTAYVTYMQSSHTACQQQQLMRPDEMMSWAAPTIHRSEICDYLSFCLSPQHFTKRLSAERPRGPCFCAWTSSFIWAPGTVSSREADIQICRLQDALQSVVVISGCGRQSCIRWCLHRINNVNIGHAGCWRWWWWWQSVV